MKIFFFISSLHIFAVGKCQQQSKKYTFTTRLDFLFQEPWPCHFTVRGLTMKVDVLLLS